MGKNRKQMILYLSICFRIELQFNQTIMEPDSILWVNIKYVVADRDRFFHDQFKWWWNMFWGINIDECRPVL